MCIQSYARGAPYRKCTTSRLLFGAGSIFLVRVFQKILCVLRSWGVFGPQPIFQSSPQKQRLSPWLHNLIFSSSLMVSSASRTCFRDPKQVFVEKDYFTSPGRVDVSSTSNNRADSRRTEEKQRTEKLHTRKAMLSRGGCSRRRDLSRWE